MSMLSSPALTPLPGIDFDASVMVHPEDFNNWDDLFTMHPGVSDYLLTAGDYSAWGPYTFHNRSGERHGRPAAVRYYNPADDESHPVVRGPSAEARIDSFKFWGESTTSWVLHGLTFRRPSKHLEVSQGASQIVFDYCLIEDFDGYGIRLRASSCRVQRCVIRNSHQILDAQEGSVNDTVGIQVGKTRGHAVTDVSILDSEIYNCGDGIQVSMNSTRDGSRVDPLSNVSTLIEGNDIYLDAARHIDGSGLTWDENALDIKAGSDDPESTVIRANRMWGFRRNAAHTAEGELVVVNDCCRNAVIEDNFFGDAPRGMKDEGWYPPAHLERDLPRYIVFRANQWHDIGDRAEMDRGAVIKPVTSAMTFVENHFARCQYLLDVPPDGGYLGDGPIIEGNLLADVGVVQRRNGTEQLATTPGPRLRRDDHNTVVTAPSGYQTYDRRRWTGPETVEGAVPLGS